MKQSFSKIFGAVSAVFLIGLFVTAAPVRAASTDERIKAMEAELNQLKAEQQQVKQEQSLIKADALAARAKLPSFRYRPGSGLRIRGADRYWEVRIVGEVSAHLSVFPGGGRSPEDEDDEGPSQGAVTFRHLQLGQVMRLHNGLYEFGLNVKCDRSGGSQCRQSGKRMTTRFSKWSPYYPDLRFAAVRTSWSPLSRVSSSSGLSLERAPAYTALLSTGSTTGIQFHWSDVPVGPMNIDYFQIAYTPGKQFDDPFTQNPLSQKAIVLNMAVEPFAKNKNKYIKGLKIGFGYYNGQNDDNRGGPLDDFEIETRTRNNKVVIVQMSSRGRRSYLDAYLDWTAGPWYFNYTYGQHVAEQRRQGDNGDPAFPSTGQNFSDARLNTNTIGAAVYLWGPKGFLSGSRNGGWRLSYTHSRNYWDLGSGYAAQLSDGDDEQFLSLHSGGAANAMKRNHYVENIVMLSWYQRRNIRWALEYQVNLIGKMRGDEKVTVEARRRLNILSDGGYYQALTLAAKWAF